MTGRRIVIASNRGPVAFEHNEANELVPQRGAGGLVTALLGALLDHDAEWIAAAMTHADRQVAAGADAPGVPAHLRFVVVPEDRYDRYYNQISNGILWFVHHYLWDTVRSPAFDDTTPAAWDDYVAVNESFAEALAERGDAAFLVQDYQLALVPGLLRERRPDARIAHFSHTPFAGATYLRIIPARMRQDLLRGMLGADILGFQSAAWAENFLMSARGLPGTRVDLARSRVRFEGRDVLVRVYPISVEARSLRAAATAPEVRRRRRRFDALRGDRALLLRVDRLELTKNIVRGFLAYEEFLRQNPSWLGKVTFLALLSPSRMELPEYRTYTEECILEAERINDALGDATWAPIEVRIEDDQVEVVAAYALYDALLVNPVFDGMNLVAMEGPILNRRAGVLILSRNAGAHGRLGIHAVSVNPFDLAETAGAIREALEMPRAERERRSAALRRTALADTPARWLRRQLTDLDRLRGAG